MDTFELDGKKCISINGKDYFLLRGYQRNYDNFIFLQVSGNTSLNKEDMPTKDWDILKSKVGSKRVWTAYKRNYFNYSTERENPTLAFLGATTHGSYLIALKFISKRFNRSLQDKDIFETAGKYVNGELSNWCLRKQDDLGNSGTHLILVEFDYRFDEEKVSEILKGETHV